MKRLDPNIEPYEQQYPESEYLKRQRKRAIRKLKDPKARTPWLGISVNCKEVRVQISKRQSRGSLAPVTDIFSKARTEKPANRPS